MSNPMWWNNPFSNIWNWKQKYIPKPKVILEEPYWVPAKKSIMFKLSEESSEIFDHHEFENYLMEKYSEDEPFEILYRPKSRRYRIRMWFNILIDKIRRMFKK